MKKFLAVIVILAMMAVVVSLAESDEIAALSAQRDKLIAELQTVNAQLAKLKKEQGESDSVEALGKIKDLFPDEVLASVIRDECAKFSIEQTVTRAEIEKIEALSMRNVWQGYGEVKDLTGIGYLVNLEYIWADYCGVKNFPEEMRNCTHLQYLDFQHSDLEELPDWIGEFTELRSLDVYSTNISSLPETIGNLKNLTYLSIGRTKITALPESIYVLQLNVLNMEGLPIK